MDTFSRLDVDPLAQAVAGLLAAGLGPTAVCGGPGRGCPVCEPDVRAAA